MYLVYRFTTKYRAWMPGYLWLSLSSYVPLNAFCLANCIIGYQVNYFHNADWAPSGEFVSSSIPSWQILTAHDQPFRGARDLAFCLKVPLDSLLVWASSGGSGETARMRRLVWTFAARIADKYQIRLTRPNWNDFTETNLNQRLVISYKSPFNVKLKDKMFNLDQFARIFFQ